MIFIILYLSLQLLSLFSSHPGLSLPLYIYLPLSIHLSPPLSSLLCPRLLPPSDNCRDSLCPSIAPLDSHPSTMSSGTSARSVFGPCEDADVKTEPDKFAHDNREVAKISNDSIAPFLMRHIPGQYAPLGSQPDRPSHPSNANSKFCYRHRPDLKCRRQADEPSMEKLQEVRAHLPPRLHIIVRWC